MRLAPFIRQNVERILQEWQDFAVTLRPLSDASQVELRDRAKDMLITICVDLDTVQVAQQSIDKSHGNAPNVVDDTASESHAVDRLQSGLTIEELLAEYRALRASVLRMWQSQNAYALQSHLQDMTRFNEAVDQSLTESIARYSFLHRESQSVFLAILGHDVRNPLGAISMGSQLLLLDEALPLKYGRVASQINRSVKRVNELVSDLMDFSITHLGNGIPITLAPMNFAIECTAIVEELRMFYPDHDIRMELEGDLSATWDRARIGQALSNLVANAVQHGNTGSPVWVTVSADKGDIVCMIQNEGSVISADELRFMFDPGKRFAVRSVVESNSSNNGHLGLGLYVTRAIVEAHHGRIHVSSTETEGTTFTLQLPRG